MTFSRTRRVRTSSPASRNARDLSELADVMPEIHARLIEILRQLDAHYNDMQDVEFTIEEGKLYILQTRSAKRPPQAAVRVAIDMVERGRWSKRGGACAHGRRQARRAAASDLRPVLRIRAARRPASPPRRARQRERSCSRAEEAVAAAQAGEDVILVRPFTEAEDVAGFHAARGILTSEGGKASHAALVARGMGRPCVCGASELDIDLGDGVVNVNGRCSTRAT